MTLNPHIYLKKLTQLPVTLLILISLICLIGFAGLYSAAGGHIKPWALKQMMHFALFMPVAILVALIDLRSIYNFSYLFYIGIMILLISVEVFGTTIMGAKRWLDIGFIRLQPSEPAKLAIVLMLAKYFHQLEIAAIGQITKILPALLATMMPILLILKEPDLGTGIITIIVVAVIFFAAGGKMQHFALVGAGGLICLPVIWHVLHPYQKRRIMIFLNPESEPLGAGYNIIQSKIAIGSGGFSGKGWILGTQSHLDFLPEHQTDFIFATLAEEFGFFGGMILLVLYALVIIISLTIAVNVRAIFSKLMVIGITSIFFSHIFVNLAMVMGLLPVVGVPLPFISYGGTMIASMLIGFGLIMNAKIHRHHNI